MGAAESAIAKSEHWFKGEDRTINIDVDQADGTTPQDMSGWALTWELKDSATGLARITKTTAAGITITNGDGTNDRAQVTIADVDTEPLVPGTYYHQLRRTDAGSEVVLSFGDAVLLDSGIS